MTCRASTTSPDRLRPQASRFSFWIPAFCWIYPVDVSMLAAPRRTSLGIVRLASRSLPACLVVVSSIIPHEWKVNVTTVTDEIVRHFRKMEEHSSHFHDACQALGIVAPFGRSSCARLGLAEALRDLSNQILDLALCLDADDGSRSRAVTRVVRKIPPSERSGEVKDSAIIEEYLAVCQRLQAAKFRTEAGVLHFEYNGLLRVGFSTSRLT